MASSATSSAGIKVQMGDGATPTEAFATIAEITGVDGPNESAAQIECTSFDSTAKEFVSALADSGEVKLDMNFVGKNAKQQALRTDLRAGTQRNFKILLPDAATDLAKTTVSFTANIQDLSGPKASTGGIITQSCTLKVTGQPVWTYATGT